MEISKIPNDDHIVFHSKLVPSSTDKSRPRAKRTVDEVLLSMVVSVL